MTPTASILDVAVAAPVAFAVGFLAGLTFARRYMLISRDRYRVVPRDHDRE